jgi:phage tail sheath protein FI
MQYLSRGNTLYYVRVGNTTGDDALALAQKTFTTSGGTPTDVFTAYAITPGEWANSVKIKIIPGSTTFTLEVYEGTKTRPVEVWKNLSTDSTSANFIETILGTVVSTDGIETVPGQSRYIVVDSAVTDGTLPAAVSTATALTGGESGLSAAAADFVGTVTDGVRSGLQCFAVEDDYDLSLVCVPGITDDTTVGAAITLAETLGDCIAIIDVPQTAANSTDCSTFTSDFDSSYAAAYWPWVTVEDPYTRAQITLPPSGFVLAQYAYNDAVSYPWFAPAGWQRGRINGIKELTFKADAADRGIMLNDSCVNPIVNVAGQGTVIWGQKTLQKQASVTDRVNVRRMLSYLKKALRQGLLPYVFQPNTPRTWQSVSKAVTSICNRVKNAQGLYDFRVVIDETTVTPDDINNHVMPGKVYLQPTQTAEFIALDLTLVPTGVLVDEE